MIQNHLLLIANIANFAKIAKKTNIDTKTNIAIIAILILMKNLIFFNTGKLYNLFIQGYNTY